ncbi:hypothetical protein C8R43DRAFT_885149 [Mycena crocata]|nr:hypothetical protein C8R43DRAFT_885149 [Mycena crocata]
MSLKGDEGDLPFEIEIHERGKRVIVWSKKCLKTSTPHSPHCQECESLHARLDDLARIARDARKGTNYKFLSHDQLRELLVERNEELNKLKLQTLNMGRRLGTFARKMDDFERLIMAIATNDVPRIHSIIETAMRNGVSIRTMANRIYEAFDGLYHTKGFTDFERDLGILIYRLGGRSLLYSMNHALNLPSLRTICNSAKFVKITPTIGPISEHEMAENIKNVLLKPRSESQVPTTGKFEWSVIMDEVALEEMAVYFSHANQVGGFCQKHTGGVNLTLATHDSALNLVEKLATGEIHFAKEMLLVTVKCNNESTIYPILCAPTCKQETWRDTANLFELIMSVWGKEAQDALGNIRDFATDGDGLRRKAGHEIFMKIELKRGDRLFIYLSDLPGLNLFTGPGLILMTFDWRHIMKRICTLLRHIQGMIMDNGRIMNPASLRRCLLLLPDQDEASVQRLINPDDPQHVPHAIELLEAIIRLRTHRAELNVPASEVDTNTDLDAITLFSFMIQAFLDAFTDPTASLSNQIENLSLYAHMSFVLFKKFRLKFMSNQLYGDSQTMVKNIVFTVAKQQNLDPSGIVNAYNDGSDPVENHFGYLRELGEHNSAMTYKQAIERSGWACDIHGVHNRNPGLHPGHHRRNITRTEIKDHLNEHNFTGDLVAGHCCLASSWRGGKSKMMAIFEQYSHLPREVYDVATILKSEADLDFLRPFGDGTYPGISDDVDRSLPSRTKATDATPVTNDATTDAPAVGSSSIPPPASSSVPLTASPSAEPEIEFDPDSFEDLLPDSTVPTITLEDVLQSEESEPAVLKLEPRPGVRPEDYLLDSAGKFVHKASICRLILNKNFIAKSRNRTERAMGNAIKNVRTYTKPTGGRPALNGSITGSSFINGDLFITLIRSTAHVSLAVVRCTEIFVDGKRMPDVNINSIKNIKANIKLTGQILRLKAVPSRPEDFPAESGDGIDDPALTWLWTGLYLMGKSIMKGTKIATDAPHLISVPGHLVEPINPTAISAHDRLSVEEVHQINSTGTTWAMNDVLLHTLIAQLWKRVEDSQMGLREVPSLKEIFSGFPYSLPSLPALVSEAGTAFATAKSIRNVCLYCNETPTNWRGHMGGHILRKMRKAGDAMPTYNHVGETYPCGFCGRSNQRECAITMKPKSDGFDIETRCRHQVSFHYKPANTGSTTTPSRNVPVICGLCPTPPGRYPTFPAVWRYNMAQHLLDEHPEYASPYQPEGDPLPFKVWESARINQDEELALGVPAFLVPPPFTKFVAGPAAGDRVEKRTKGNGDRAEAGGKSKRGRTL